MSTRLKWFARCFGLICTLAALPIAAQEPGTARQDDAPPAADPAEGINWPVPAGWNHETIPFPLGFAPQLPYRGVEVLRFAPGWSKPDQTGYWSYTFVWWLTEKPVFDAATLEGALTIYFRGLSQAVGEGRFQIAPNLFGAELVLDSPAQRLTGQIRTMDAFTTGLPLTLNVVIESRECVKAGRHAITFTLSPRPRTDPIWQDLQSTARSLVCE